MVVGCGRVPDCCRGHSCARLCRRLPVGQARLSNRATGFPPFPCESYRDVRSKTTGGLQGADTASNVAVATTLLIGRPSMPTETAPGFRPMSEFDPALPEMVHDQLNDETFEWQPEKWLEHYRQYACDFGYGLIEWDGLLLDGWRPMP